MIPQRTVLILGAGASRPYMFPTGQELTNLILERDEEPVILGSMGFTTLVGPATQSEPRDKQYHRFLEERLEVHQVQKYELQEFQKRFRLSQAYSIDAFVADNPEYMIIASLMIACILLKCEQTDRLEGDWYKFLFNELISEGKDFPEDTLSIITFNYDRSLEMYLHQAFLYRYNLMQAEAWALVKRIEVIHVYGDLGPLFNDKGEPIVRYGFTGAMREASTYIRLVDRRTHSEHASEIRSVLDRASKIIFLGFGFDELNLSALQSSNREAIVFASCYGLSVPAMSRAEKNLQPTNAIILPSANGQRIRWGAAGHKVFEFLRHSPALA